MEAATPHCIGARAAGETPGRYLGRPGPSRRELGLEGQGGAIHSRSYAKE